jgi:hypothetical protein
LGLSVNGLGLSVKNGPKLASGLGLSVNGLGLSVNPQPLGPLRPHVSRCSVITYSSYAQAQGALLRRINNLAISYDQAQGVYAQAQATKIRTDLRKLLHPQWICHISRLRSDPRDIGKTMVIGFGLWLWIGMEPLAKNTA